MLQTIYSLQPAPINKVCQLSAVHKNFRTEIQCVRTSVLSAPLIQHDARSCCITASTGRYLSSNIYDMCGPRKRKHRARKLNRLLSYNQLCNIHTVGPAADSAILWRSRHSVD